MSNKKIVACYQNETRIYCNENKYGCSCWLKKPEARCKRIQTACFYFYKVKTKGKTVWLKLGQWYPGIAGIWALEKGDKGVSRVLIMFCCLMEMLNTQVCLVWEKFIEMAIYDGALFC